MYNVEPVNGADNGQKVNIYGDIYNGNKDSVTYVTSHDFLGMVGTPKYPDSIKSGKWSKFTHDGTADKSSAAVVYCGKNTVGDECDILLAWSKDSGTSIKAYTEIQEAGYAWDWDDINAKLGKSSANCSCEYNGCVSEVELGDKFTATLSLKP